MRITKELASQVSRKLSEKKLKEKISLEEELQKYVYSVAIKMIPKDVLVLFNKHKDYFSQATHLQFCGCGFNYESFYFKNPLPIKNNRITPEKDVAEKVLKMKNEIDNKAKELNTLRCEIESALLSLRTYKNIECEFPEAFKLLPKENKCQSLVVNISAIREKL